VTETDHPGGRPVGLRHRGTSVAVAMAVMNLAAYGFTALAARLLGPTDYGALASLMAVLLVVSVVQLGFQTTAARRISADPEHVAQIEREILTLTYWAAGILGIGLLVLTPVIDRLLRLDSLATASLVALCAVPLTITGGQLGVLQGERRWWPVAVIYVASGVPKLVIATALLVWRPTELNAMLGVFLGAIVPVVLGAYALRRRRSVESHSEHHSTRPIVREVLGNAQALLAFLCLINCDVILARNVLGEHDAGLYAAGLILTKAMLFLPQFVVVVAFPSMSTAHERRRALLRSLALIAGLGALGVLACAVLPRLALVFVGGSEYSEIQDRLWLFAVLGTVLSLLQLLVYAVLARRGTHSVYLVWGTLVALLAIGSQATTVTGLLLVVVAVDSALFLALLAISLHRLKMPVTGEEPPPEPVM
jgi:O-antigen/teichoic acid export membrane protein